MVDCRAQTFTLEAAITTLLIVLVMLYISQAIPLTPLTSSAANVMVENTLEMYAGDVLNTLTYEPICSDISAENLSILKKALLSWNGAVIDGGASSSEYDTSFENISNALPLKYVLINAFEKKGLAYNIDIYYKDAIMRKLRFIYNGQPSNNAIIATQVIPIYDTDYENGIKKYIPDIDSSNLYNVLYVRLTVWRM
ncbi:hypothetical protein Asulf_01465 [Archaeoglobus sulfaticallidus PM70-1]|uniref:Uncharacterized protein n=1 Tax=Archaeoglobus sulfaticallidus PM70-1 TaxID=387631 RepID=N0BEL0_9EURY|nr:hypothetical protein [Archaeoglobus sulfaticallidus]AGK61448.1 hypothetical protein Asulf_01465 [Archaeoglobus sulfaticallidus PM70-1]